MKYIDIEMRLTLPCPYSKTEILSKYCNAHCCKYFKALSPNGKTLFGAVVCSYDEEGEPK
jgi:hypothetical protein